jgi:hypothetical protein
VEVASALKERCRADSDDVLAPDAADMARSAEQDRASIDADLAELVVHRNTLVTTLVGLSSTQRRLLTLVNRASRLPDGLGDLSGQAAFKIDFEPLPEAEARVNLARRVDDWADILAGGKRLGREERVSWLCTATADTVARKPTAGPWRVKVLKPEVSGVVTYKDPERIPVEYSGGQELTLAVMLYCTLASVRSSQRTDGERPAGTLVLDNPFGAASNAVLIELQQALAARAGVQLICATGINDPTVRAAFEGDSSRVLELRNDRDQRQYLSYLRVADPTVKDAVIETLGAGRDSADPAGYLSATGYRVRGQR